MTVLGIKMVPCSEKLRILLVPVRSVNQFCTFQLIAAPCLLDVKVDNCLLAFTVHKKRNRNKNSDYISSSIVGENR